MAGSGGQGTAVVAFNGAHTLGNYIENLAYFASVARELEDPRVLMIFRDDRPYKRFTTLLSPYLTDTLALPADPDVVLPLDWFDGRVEPGARPFKEEWYEMGFHDPDLFLTANMFDSGLNSVLGALPRFRVPPPLVPSLSDALRAQGVDGERWFACLHMRESGYEHRDADPRRDVDPFTYLPMINRIIRDQGGQVVRLGDPTMTGLPEMEGLVDLGRLADSWPLQAFALSRARFFVGTESGPLTLAGLFRVPTAQTNSMSAGLWNEADLVVLRGFVTPDGRRIGRRELEELGTLTVHNLLPDHWDVVPNSPELLARAADFLHESSAPCDGWREDGGEIDRPRARRVKLPLPWRDVLDFSGATIWD